MKATARTKVVGHRSSLNPTNVSNDFCSRPSEAGIDEVGAKVVRSGGAEVGYSRRHLTARKMC